MYSIAAKTNSGPVGQKHAILEAQHRASEIEFVGFDGYPAATQTLGCKPCCVGTSERIKDEVAGFCAELDEEARYTDRKPRRMRLDTDLLAGSHKSTRGVIV